jgi:DNA-directed RNA polymerase specialized sigma24 family protein
MADRRSETELRQFYERWAAVVDTFCRLYLGNPTVAEEVVTESFLQYFRRELPLWLDHVPTALMSLALEESNCRVDVAEGEAGSDFEWAMLRLPPDQRAVFILHGVLGLQLPWVAAVTRIGYAEVCRLWVCSLLQLRMLTVHDGCSRLFDECGPAPEAAPGACA